MNLFCLSVEGSTESLYQPAEHSNGCQDNGTHPSRLSGPSPLLRSITWCGSEPCIPSGGLQEWSHTSSLKKEKRRSHGAEAVLSTDTRAQDITAFHSVFWQASRRIEDWTQTKNGQKEVMDKELLEGRLSPEEERGQQHTLERREGGQNGQMVNCETWKLNGESPGSQQLDWVPEAVGEEEEGGGTLKRIQKLVRAKRGRRNSAEEGRTPHDPTSDRGPTTGAVFDEDDSVITCIGLSKRAERKAAKEPTGQLWEQQQDQRPQDQQQSQQSKEHRRASDDQPQQRSKERRRASTDQQQQGSKDRRSCSTDLDMEMDMELSWSPRLHLQHRWASGDISPVPWDHGNHTCQRHRGEQHQHLRGLQAPLPCRTPTPWDRYESLVLEMEQGWGGRMEQGWGGRGVCGERVPPPCGLHSLAHLDLPERSSSFGKFDTFRSHARQAKAEENGDSEPSAEAEESPESEQSRQGTISKKMKAISLTMRKRMGKKYIKALSEEMGEDAEAHEKEKEKEADTETSSSLAKGYRRSSNSLESLYSHNSGQSSSSGVTSGSEGSSNRDSLRLEEETPYTGQFCGRARVHTDFVPSPYDTESLRLKVGDVIEVINKPPMGIWTGMLNNRVGTFKFIYVDVLVEKEPEPRRRAPNPGRSKRPRPNTLLELLACLNLEEHASSLMLNGYQTVEDLKELKEQHLIELNMTDPEHRHRLLAATECLHEPDHAPKDGDGEEPPVSPSGDVKAELKDCPRDSGCYIPSDVSDSGSKDNTVNLVALDSAPAEA